MNPLAILLRGTIDVLSDPNQVVLDPRHCLETAEGSDATFGEERSAARVCFLWAFERAGRLTGQPVATEDYNVFDLVKPYLPEFDDDHPYGDDFTATLAFHGAEGCIRALNETLAWVEA